MSAKAGDGLILAVNAGSSSLKVAGFSVVDGALRDVLRIGIDLSSDKAPAISGDPALCRAVQATALTLAAKRNGSAFIVALLDAVPVTAVAHRVVHGGDEPRECVPLDDAQRAALHALSPLAPLHQPAALAIVDAIANAQPALPQFACLDTAFHTGMPAVAREYALPQAIRARHPHLHAFGFHGISCRSAVEQLRGAGLPARLIIAHLGSGASVTAVRNGHSIATSMGFSALDGLPMATRPGRIDPGVLLYLLRHEQPDVDALEDLLYRRSGLLGISGISGDMRVLLASDNPAAKNAVDFFVYRNLMEIGALTAALGGLDALVFTGGVGEHQGIIRARIGEGLRWLGASIDPAANARHAQHIGAADSRIALRVVACDEEAVMAAGVRGQQCATYPAAPTTRTTSGG